MIAGGNWWRANEIVLHHLSRWTLTRHSFRDEAVGAKSGDGEIGCMSRPRVRTRLRIRPRRAKAAASASDVWGGSASSQIKCLRRAGLHWQGGVFTSFDPLGLASTTINGVNDLVDIVGFYTNSSDAVVGFVGTPVPEPSTWAWCLSGSRGLVPSVIARLARRRWPSEPCFKGADGSEGSRRSGPLFRQSNTKWAGSEITDILVCIVRVHQRAARINRNGNPWDGHGADSALVPASPSIEATAAQQKHDDDDDEKSRHIHDGVSFGRMFGYLISPAAGRTWLLVTARAAPLFL
jgi:hypothetical protein